MNNFVFVGTCGWDYKHWYEVFYPEVLKEKNFLGFYSKTFKSVEINNTFYHLPSDNSVNRWCEAVDDDFIFSVKASKYITHVKRLKDCDRRVENFLNTLKPFENKLGPILFQLPPNFDCNIARLEQFLQLLRDKHRFVFEFRNHNWFNDEVFALLRKHNIALCVYYMGDYVTPEIITSDFVYIRYHYSSYDACGLFNEVDIVKFADDINQYVKEGKSVYAYFNNDACGAAIKNALLLQQKLFIA